MPFGTAMGRLRKILLFEQLKKHGEHVCFKCSKFIETVEELSVEHKQPWLHVSPELFWDIDNIAFSHLKCNKPDRPYKMSESQKAVLRKIGPEGTAWCQKHQQFLPIENFSKSKIRWNGLNTRCRDCDHYWRETKVAALQQHGLPSYKVGCRCQVCVDAYNLDMKLRMQKYREKGKFK